jgi:hypothetical protein
MLEIRFDKTKDEVALLIWFLVDHSVYSSRITSETRCKACANHVKCNIFG